MDRPTPSAAAHPVFSFGTLLDPAVQQHLFGRTLTPRPAELAGHDVVDVRITDPAVVAASGKEIHPGVVRTAGASVAGGVLDLTAEELAAADRYEVAAYARRRALTAEGEPVWTYLLADPLAAARRLAVGGDSIAYGRTDPEGGWQALLGRAHVRGGEQERRWYCLACPGTTVAWSAQHLGPEAAARGADTVLVCAGTNDILLEGATPVETVAAVAGLCEDLESRGMRPVVVGPVWAEAAGLASWLGRGESAGAPAAETSARAEAGARALAEYRTLLAEWAQETFRDHLDPWPALEGRPDLLSDGLHPDAEGHRLLAACLAPGVVGGAADGERTGA